MEGGCSRALAPVPLLGGAPHPPRAGTVNDSSSPQKGGVGRARALTDTPSVWLVGCPQGTPRTMLSTQ